ncbi:hypothetical protein [Asticcacaulis sp. AC402]|uniref:hypothetical protein n=1 Tax=Asticcacaulis sp. AC402 TaxID=1282361 RepID=UPI0003C3C630|nr:hypothetical protein [Asticcacaulis sp. AC402]ESQ74089.1 hypothetical protein ABAC402_15670 [Asticcacaulis sp. AC402]
MLIKDGFFVDLEGVRDFTGRRDTYCKALQDRKDPNLFHIGGYRYDAYGQSLQPHAPKVIDVWHGESETKGHAKERRMKMRDDGAFADIVRALESRDQPWKTQVRLFDMKPYDKLRGTCLACGLSVVHQVRRLVEEARYGTRTVQQIEDASVCRRLTCKGRVTIERERP